jgi:CRP/FNR family transcriptional regulator
LTVQGDSAWCLYLVRRGVVKLTTTSTQGRPAVLALVGPGELFGEQAVLESRGAPAGWPSGRDWGSPAATALTDGEASLVPASEVWMREDLSYVVEALAARLCGATASLERVIHHGPTSRLAGALVDLARRFGVPAERGIEVPFPLAQQDLASMVGTARETVNRSLAALRAMGWIDGDGRRLVVIDASALRRFAQEGP